MSSHLTGRFLAFLMRVLGRTSDTMFESVRLFFVFKFRILLKHAGSSQSIAGP